ncbi:MAG: hypothetical protein IJ735_02060 [Clostridia bacterium]|nr:hypothetical protein [Clostridia bacterium]
MRVSDRETVVEKARAKINFVLNVGKKRGARHELDTVIVPIDLFDTVSLTARTDGEVVIRYDGISDKYPHDPAKDLAKAIVKRYGLPGVSVDVQKRVPEGAGLGGSSTDAGALARGLERLFSFGKIDAGLLTEVGSDVYAAYLDRPCRVRGTGDVVEVLEDISTPSICLYTFDFGVSTAECYALFDKIGGEEGDVEDAILAMRRGEEFLPKNGLLRAACRIRPGIAARLEMLRAEGLSCGMTGSGSALFAFGYDKEQFLKKLFRSRDLGTKTTLFRE